MVGGREDGTCHVATFWRKGWRVTELTFRGCGADSVESRSRAMSFGFKEA